MLFLEYLEMQKDVTKSIQFNILVICLITKNTKFPDFIFWLAEYKSDTLKQN